MFFATKCTTVIPNVVCHIDVVVGLSALKTQRICNLEVRSHLRTDHITEQY